MCVCVFVQSRVFSFEMGIKSISRVVGRISIVCVFMCVCVFIEEKCALQERKFFIVAEKSKKTQV